MSNSVGIAVTAEPLPSSRAVVPRAPTRPDLLPRPPASETAAQRQGRPTSLQARPAEQEADGSGAGKQPPRTPPAGGRPQAPPLAASAGFLAQVLAQAPDGRSESALQRHRDGPGLGSSAYRRAGGEPPLYPEAATLFRLSV